jgi:hypothetical protein
MKKDFELLMKAYEMEKKKSAYCGLPRPLSVNMLGVFYYYCKLGGAKPEDWNEFAKWIRIELKDKFTFQPAFITLSGADAEKWLEYLLARHRINVKYGIEKPSEPEFWAMCREIIRKLKPKIEPSFLIKRK